MGSEEELIIILGADPLQAGAGNENRFPPTFAGCNDAIALIEKYRANLLPE